MGLGFFRPGELIDREVNLEAQIPDCPHNPLMGEGEGVEGPGEEGDLIPVLKAERAVIDPLQRCLLYTSRKKDGIERILRRRLGFHRKKVMEHRQVDWPSANPEKAGQDSQYCPDSGCRGRSVQLMGTDPRPIDGIEQRPERHSGQCRRLNRSDKIRVGGAVFYQCKKLLADHAARRR